MTLNDEVTQVKMPMGNTGDRTLMDIINRDNTSRSAGISKSILARIMSSAQTNYV